MEFCLFYVDTCFTSGNDRYDVPLTSYDAMMHLRGRLESDPEIYQRLTNLSLD